MTYSPLRSFGRPQVCFDPLTAVTVAGGVLSAAGTIAGGVASKNSADFTAAQMEQQAGESRAAGQRQAFERDRETKLALSKLQARAAASGGGASDPTVTNLAGDIAGRGEYQHLMEMYKGENRARGLEDEAMGARMTGAAKRDAAFLSAGGTLLGSAGSAYRTYKRMPLADEYDPDSLDSLSVRRSVRGSL